MSTIVQSVVVSRVAWNLDMWAEMVIVDGVPHVEYYLVNAITGKLQDDE